MRLLKVGRGEKGGERGEGRCMCPVEARYLVARRVVNTQMKFVKHVHMCM
jgi:hypothetical protein